MSPPEDRHDLATLCIHAGRRPGPEDGAVVTPIYQSATFVPGEADRALLREGRVAETRFYSRYGNPTVAALERRLAALDGAAGARCFASGNAAMHAALMATALPGGHVVAAERIYGGTRRLLEGCLEAAGGSVDFVDIDDRAAVEAAFRPDTRLLLCESLANPTLEVADLPTLARLAHDHGARLAVDATYATPILQRPLALGADVVVHSASKYLGGHADLIAGVVAGGEELLARVTDWRMDAGGCLDPHTAFLIDRGVKTLALRMRAHQEGARALADFLEGHPRVVAVAYPGLASSPQHARARELLSGGGGMLSFTLDGDDEAAARVLDRLRVALAAPSLGSVETLVSQPATSSHAHMSAEERAAIGIHPGCVRVSVGIEAPADLVADFAQALEA